MMNFETYFDVEVCWEMICENSVPLQPPTDRCKILCISFYYIIYWTTNPCYGVTSQFLYIALQTLEVYIDIKAIVINSRVPL